MKKLNPKQRRFVSEYLVDLNATQAAIRAGYSKKTAGQIGEQNLRKLEISQAIQEAQTARSERTEVTQDAVLRELAAMSFYDAGEIGRYKIKGPEDVEKLPDHLRRCVIGWSWDRNGNFTLKLADKLGATQLAMRHLGMFTDHVDHTTKGAKLQSGDPAVINVTVG